MSQHIEQAIEYSGRWIELIHKPQVNEREAKAIIEESKRNFAEHFNRGLRARQPNMAPIFPPRSRV